VTNTPLRSVRVPEDLWQAATVVANRNGETISDVVREALREYVGSEK
jgi:metal-responsive CopG/Arc/MetJ family transcriptional regulator